MARCIECWYAKRTTVTTYEPAWTCLHPMSLQQGKVGYPIVCGEMRAEKAACGPEGALFPAEVPGRPGTEGEIQAVADLLTHPAGGAIRPTGGHPVKSGPAGSDLETR